MKISLTYLLIIYSALCISQSTIPDKTEMCKRLHAMTESDQMYRKMIPDAFNENENQYSRTQIDSLWSLQIEIDNQNTRKLIDLTKTYGWLSNERLNCKKLNVWLIFRHSQREYHSEISELIEKEHLEARLRNFEYKLIKDHINGRVGG